MRLLQYSESGELSIYSFDDGDVPPYAILSHTWGADGDEVTFADLQTGGGKTKPGYKKIIFCGEQARHDSLQYFWIDTCCIDKANKAELAFSIRSMFRWYRDAARCYVYLSDVSDQPLPLTSSHNDSRWLFWIWVLSILYTMSRWYGSTMQRYFYSRDVLCTSVGSDLIQSKQKAKLALKNSRWFTRGWTLQELLAPSIVEFFSKEGTKLGDKLSLAKEVCEVTGISSPALQGEPLSNFSVHERVTWIEHRTTTIPADRAYSLMGILGVSLSPIDDENLAEAMKRVLDEVDKQNKCLQDLCPSNPRDDKKRIEETKGGLLAGAYRWVLDNNTFQQWQQDPESRLLWVKGDPGKGKTMLLCGIIDELQNLTPKPTLFSYFFCQATDTRINSATAVLRGLLYMLVHRQPSLASHVRKKHDHAGKSLFEDANAWVALTEIFADVLQDAGLGTTYLIIDALDECATDLPKLLSFIAKHSSASSRVKWIVSSRNWPDIEEELERAEHEMRLSLELNAESVAAAVDVFIRQKVCRLAQEKHYTPEVQDAVLQHLMSNANDTFLWVALVCQDLKATPKWDVQEKLAQFPPGLDSLYRQMLDQIRKSSSARRCLRVLAVAAVLYRPVTVSELVILTKQLADLVNDLESVREIIGLCRSFLTLRDDTVYFVHQSAKDFLITKALNDVFLDGIECVHQDVFAKSLVILHKTLRRDIYSLQAPGYAIENVKPLLPDSLAVSRYPCVYWIDHFCDSKPSATNQEITRAMDAFLEQKYLYWLEALSLCRSMAKGVVSMTRLWDLVQGLGDTDVLNKIVYDARRFIMYHKEAIENYPLQAYASALLFSPANSIVRRLFQHEEPRGVTIKPAMSNGWSACLQTLEGHSSGITSVTFSHDSTRLASASEDSTVKIWDASSGMCVHTLQGHDDAVVSVTFSHDSTRLASASEDSTVKIWDASSGMCVHTLQGHDDAVVSVAFSHDSARLASASRDSTVKIWNASSGACLQTLEDHHCNVTSVVFSYDSTQLASASMDSTVKIWDMSSGTCRHTLEGYSGGVNSIAFSHDSTELALALDYSTIEIWSMRTREHLHTLRGHCIDVTSVAFSHDSHRIASGSSDCTVKIWNTSSSEHLSSPWDHKLGVSSVDFSHDLTRLASGSWDRTVKIWNAISGEHLHTFTAHSEGVSSVAFSHGSNWLASASLDKTIKIWDTSSWECRKNLNHGWDVTSVAFSHDSIWLASASQNGTVKIWDVSSGTCLQTLKGHSNWVTSVAFSRDSAQLASASTDKTVRIWKATDGACLKKLVFETTIRELSFNFAGTSLHTELGTIAIPLFQTSSTDIAAPKLPYQGVSLSLDGLWVMRAGSNILWIPSEYRPSCKAVSGNLVGIGVGSGRVWLCQVT